MKYFLFTIFSTLFILSSCKTVYPSYPLTGNWDNVKDWITKTDGKNAKIKLSQVDGINEQALKVDFDLGGNGWCQMNRILAQPFPKDRPLTFSIKADSAANIEFNFIDKAGRLYHRKKSLNGNYKKWTPIILYRADAEFGWSIPKKTFNGQPVFQIAFSGSGKGTVWLDEIKLGPQGVPTTFSKTGPILDPDRNQAGIGFKQRRSATLAPEDPLVLEWLKQIQDTSSPDKILLPSMECNQAQTFNNILVAMAFILKGEKERAERILNYFANATKKDNTEQFLQNFYYKGEPRGFFQTVYLRDTKAGKAYHCYGNSDRWMGDMCWMLFAYKLYENTYKSNKYEAITQKIKDLLIQWFKEDGDGGYVQHGWRKRDTKLHENSGHHEGNIDAYAVMKLFGEDKLAAKIASWLQPHLQGNKLPLDLYGWRVLAFGKKDEKALDIPEFDLRYRKTLVHNGHKVMGFYPFASRDINNIWVGGTGHMACAYLTCGDPLRGNFYANQMDKFLMERTINGVKTKALPFTANKTGEYGWVDLNKGFASAAAWYIFAKNRFNPFTLKTSAPPKHVKLTASSSQDKIYPPQCAYDGNKQTRWSSASKDNEWLQIEFPNIDFLCGMTIFWEHAYAKVYTIQVSLDGKKWKQVFKTSQGDGGSDIIYFPKQPVKYVKITGVKRATSWGISILDMAFIKGSKAPKVTATSSTIGHTPDMIFDGQFDTYWQSGRKKQQWLKVDLKQTMDLGGLELFWAKNFAKDYTISMSENNKDWQQVYKTTKGNGKTDLIFIKATKARYLKLQLNASAGPNYELSEIILKGVAEAKTPLRLYQVKAGDAPDGHYPKWLYKKQNYWTVVGLDGDITEALISTDGAIEPVKHGFSVMPFLNLNGKLLTSGNCSVNQELEDGYLPIPSVTWQSKDLSFKQTIFAGGQKGKAAVFAEYNLKNNSEKPLVGNLFLSMRPLQVNSPWQFGGISKINSIKFSVSPQVQVDINGQPAIYPLNQPHGFGATFFDRGEIIEFIEKNNLPRARDLKAKDGMISAALRFPVNVQPGQTHTIRFILPMDQQYQLKTTADTFDKEKAKMAKYWQKRLDTISIDIPQKELVDVLKANTAYLLINRDQNSLHPGPRNYERSWIRDGSVMLAALLKTYNFKASKEYLEWVASCQLPSGEIPCMLELNGKCPGWAANWTEWDGQGAYVFAIAEYYRFTKDKALVEELFPTVVKALEFLESLRKKRLTENYKNTPFYGIIPESNSHEGYFPAKHSLWDDFFGLKGWKDGQFLAKLVGKEDLIPWMKHEENDLRKNLIKNIKLVQKEKKINFIPGCMEFGDGDTCSTAIAVWPSDEFMNLPAKSLKQSFDNHYNDVMQKRLTEGLTATYTPYELRIGNAYLLMGEKKKALEMLNYFLKDMRPRPWRHWAEVVHDVYDRPQYIGDMPHTWIGAIAINFIRNLFVYEKNNTLVIGEGIESKWLDDPKGVTITNFPTFFGKMSYTMTKRNNSIVIDIKGDATPPNGFILKSPLAQPIKHATVSGEPNTSIINNELKFEQIPAKIELEY